MTKRAALLVGTLLAVLLTLLAACGAAGSDAMSSADGEAYPEPASDAGGGVAQDEDVQDPNAVAGRGGGTAAPARASDTIPERKISTGSIALRGRDVAAVRADVQQVVDDLGGEVTEERTDTRRDGTVVHSRMVLRLPTESFADAMAAIERVADLRSSRQGTDVVTDEYIDLQARVRAQEKSLQRVEVLFSRAEDIRDIMAIEGELSRRQAELDSLKGQLRYLEDQTSMATITVNVERSPRPGADRDPDDGFLAGLETGWAGLTGMLSALATVAGAVLPFLVLLALLGLPVALLVRRLLRGRRLRPTAATG